MELRVQQGSIQEAPADTIIVNLFEGVTAPGGATGAVDRALNGLVSELIGSGDITGKLGEVAVLYPRGAIPAKRVLVAGLGNRNAFDLEAVRRAAGTAILKARDLNARQVATIVHGAGIGGLLLSAAARATIEGSLLALYHYDDQRAEKRRDLDGLTVVEFDGDKTAEIEVVAQVCGIVSEGVSLARDLINMPAGVATPSKMAAVAQEIAREHGLEVTIGDRVWAAEQKMGAFLGVTRGATQEPRFILLEYKGGGEGAEPVVLVGKGITFDSGGVSLKPPENMWEMKGDMAGAAAVLATMATAARLKLPLHLVAIAPCTENMPDGSAFHPGDILTASNGKTIEIISTDAEGRLILADALAYAARYNPKAVIDLATLTGACVTALGDEMSAGVFSNDSDLSGRILASSEATGERAWPLPLWDDYRKLIKSDTADMRNSGGKKGGVGTSAIFLKEFVSYPWVHLDIAPMSLAHRGSLLRPPYIPIGGIGYGVRLLIDFLQNWGNKVRVSYL